MANNLANGAMPGTGVDAGPIANQGPQVDAGAMQTPPDQSQEDDTGGGGPPTSKAHIFEMIHKAAVTTGAFDRLVKLGGSISRGAVIDTAVELVAKQIMSAQAMAKYLADLPADPQEIREWAQNHDDTANMNLHTLLVATHGLALPQNKIAPGAPSAGGLPGAPGAPDLSGGPPGMGGGPPQQ